MLNFFVKYFSQIPFYQNFVWNTKVTVTSIVVYLMPGPPLGITSHSSDIKGKVE